MSTALKTARAVADVTQGNILAVVEIGVPPERVFRALTDPAEVVQWWGAPDLYQVTDWQADLRVGGGWKGSGQGADGKPFSVSGEFLEIDPPRRLVQTWNPDWDPGEPTVIRYQLESIPAGTRVTIRHEGFGERADSCRDHAEGWERVLTWLANHFGPGQPAEKYFFCRLLAPRPSFAYDMTPEERNLMARHGAYWRGFLGKEVVVFGPVADPNGPWGLLVAAAASEEALRALQQGDPVIQAGRGFHFETIPMLAAVH
jgi:uncharacterized protein YndB with AHSA1/START domain